MGRPSCALSLVLILAASTLVACQDGESCSEGLCGPGTVCDTDTGTCVVDDSSTSECDNNLDCNDATQRCDDGRCVSKCEGVSCNLTLGEVCDPTTGACVGGNSCVVTSDCGPDSACVEGVCFGNRRGSCNDRECLPGLDCVNGFYGQICLEPCSSVTDCLVFESCIIDPPEQLSAFADHCFANLCRPGGDPSGIFQDAEFMAPCNADSDGDGDGVCVGPIPGNDGEFGLCFDIDGEQEHGASCSLDASHNAEDGCLNGVCLEQNLTCADVCSVFDDESCLDGHGCFPIWAGNGICVSLGASPAPGPGEVCQSAPGSMGCAEGHLCAPTGLQTGAQNVCLPMCDIQALASALGSCAEGTCTIYSPDSPRIGLCVVN